MTINYKDTLLAKDFDDAEHDVEVDIEDGNIEINAGFQRENFATMTLEQFGCIEEIVRRYREMRAIACQK